MKLKILSFAAIAMLFAACSSDEPNLPPDAENIPQVANPYQFGTYYNSYYIGGIIPVRAVPAE